MKKYISCLLVLLVLMLPMLGMEADAATIVDSGSCGENVTWTLDNKGTLTISGSGAMYDYEYMNAPWYANCDYIVSVVVKEGVTSIGDYAFAACYGLRNINIPEGVTSIGYRAFYWCMSLKSINIPKSVTSIGDEAFAYYGWDSGTPASLTGIWVDKGNPNYSSDDRGVLFDKNKSNLIQAPGAISGTYSIPEGVTSISEDAFMGCTRLSSITIPDSVTSIGDFAFYGCTTMKSITLSQSLTSIGDGVFRDCRNLISITIPDSVTSIGAEAFDSCNSLSRITIPDSVTSIGGNAFGLCLNLSHITLSKSNLVIRANAFNGCWSLNTVHYAGTQTQAEEMTILYGNDSLMNATWHYECNGKTCTPEGSPFVDIYSGDYYCDPVLWAVDNYITNGLSENTFGPAETCTRGQIVTFLQRACDRWPDIETYDIPFWDVTWDDYFCYSVLWAVEKGITSGMGDGSFAPNAPCTRGQVATFLWRACGQPAPSGTNIFTDIAPGAYYYDAVLWAVENSITNGMGDGTFAPDAPCTRGQIVTFLYRAMA